MVRFARQCRMPACPLSDLSKVLLVGGSNPYPAVQEAVKNITGKEGFKGINPDECVAIGASIQAACLAARLRTCCCCSMLPRCPSH